jgi:hypothetical protein
MRDNSRIRGHLVRAVAVGALAIGTIGLAAAPAHADTTGWGNGIVGVPMQVNVTNVTGCNVLTLEATYQDGTISAAPPVSVNFQGNATIFWTPPQAGLVTSAQIGSICTPISLPAVNIGGVSTTTVIASPNTATVGTATRINVTVTSQAPSTYQPTGSVTVRDANNAVIRTMGLTPGPGAGQSYAYWWFTPPRSGSYTFQATYNPSSGSPASSSVSNQDVLIATPSGATISISAPPTMTQGVPVTLTATVFPAGVQGSVGFTINGTPISASIPIVNGQASFVWTPNVVGQVTLGASYTTNQGGSGSTSEKVTVVPGPVAKDVITLSQPGVGVWGPNAAFQVQNGTTFTFQASTLSGAGVTLTETGPCQVSGLTLVVDTGNGQCNLTASSPGGNGYAPVQQGYTVLTVPGTQTAALAAPNSGRVNKGRTLTLEKASQGTTNAGQNITWKITKGKKICKLTFPKNGSVKLKIKKKGYCNVRASAPGVANQWNPFTLTRSYQGV